MVKICEVVDGCEDCPKYGDGCDGDKRVEHTDHISRADAIEAVHEYYQKRFTEDSKWDADAKMLVLEDKTIAKDNMEICNIINALPSADAVQGEWEKTKLKDDMWICSACGSPLMTDDISETHFCPNCGARMKGGAE